MCTTTRSDTKQISPYKSSPVSVVPLPTHIFYRVLYPNNLYSCSHRQHIYIYYLYATTYVHTIHHPYIVDKFNDYTTCVCDVVVFYMFFILQIHIVLYFSVWFYFHTETTSLRRFFKILFPNFVVTSYLSIYTLESYV